MTAGEKVVKLCDLFNIRSADIGYLSDRKEWYVSLPGVYVCVETGSTMRHQDGTVEKLLAAGHSPSGRGKTFEEAVEKLEQYTIGRKGLLLSNQSFGLFCGGDDDDGPHMITVYEGDKQVETFPYDKEKIRTLLHKYAL